MATPKGAITGVVQSITISSAAKASPENQQMGNLDTVQYQNGSAVATATVNFMGAAANLFGSSIINVPNNNGVSTRLTPHQTNVTVDYMIAMGPIHTGPYSIEIGTGPLEIDIIDAAGDTNLPNAAVGNDSTLFFKNLTTNETATITFGGDQVLYDANGNLVTSQVVHASSSGAVLMGKGLNKNVSYMIAMSPSPSGRVRSGSGSIKVGH